MFSEKDSSSRSTIADSADQQEILADKCPVKLTLEIVQNELMFKWRCDNILSDEAFSCRSVLIIDADCASEEETMLNLVEMFYRRLSLGHFVKVLCLGATLRQPWIQKTANKFPGCQIIRQSDDRVNLIQAFKFAVVQSKKLVEITDITIFANGVGITQQLKELQKMMAEHRYYYPVTLFLRTTAKEVNQHPDFPTYIYSTEEELKKEMKSYFKKKQRTKIASCQLHLQSINGDMLLKAPVEANSVSDWKLQEDDCLVKRNYFMRSDVEYIQALSINNFNDVNMIFKLEFSFELTDSRKYLMTSVFNMATDNKSLKGEGNSHFLKNYDCITERFTEAKHRVFHPPQNVVFTKCLMAALSDV